MQEYIRYVGKGRDSASGILLKGSSSVTLQQGSCRKLSPSELMDMIERMGHHIDLENPERIGPFYDIKKKLLFPFTVLEHAGRQGAFTRYRFPVHLPLNC